RAGQQRDPHLARGHANQLRAQGRHSPWAEKLVETRSCRSVTAILHGDIRHRSALRQEQGTEIPSRAAARGTYEPWAVRSACSMTKSTWVRCAYPGLRGLPCFTEHAGSTHTADNERAPCARENSDVFPISVPVLGRRHPRRQCLHWIEHGWRPAAWDAGRV